MPSGVELSTPPKSGRRLTEPRRLMKVMKFPELASTGAELMSRFHQLVAGNRGRGPGSGPPWHGGPLGQVGVWARATGAHSTAPRANALSRTKGSYSPVAIAGAFGPVNEGATPAWGGT